MHGRSLDQLNFNLLESLKLLLIILRVPFFHRPKLSSIVIIKSPTDDFSPSFPSISLSKIKRRIGKPRKTSVCPLDITFPFIRAFSDFLSKPSTVLFNEITEYCQYQQIRKQGFTNPLKRKTENVVLKGFVLCQSLLCSWNYMKDSL